MLDTLSGHLDNFPGATNQTRCFAHTVSILAKSIIKQFDALKSKIDDEAGDGLAALYKDLEIEEREERKEHQRNDDEDEDEPLNAWEYGEALTDEQREEHDASVQPVQSTLVKVVIGS